MTGFALNPPRTRLVYSDGSPTPEFYKFLLAIQTMIGSGESDPFDDSTLLATDAAMTATPQGDLLSAQLFTERPEPYFLPSFSEPGSLTAGIGLDGGGNMGGNVTVDLADTAVTPATYGSASEVGQFTVDQQGRITLAANVTITPAAIGGVPDSRTLTAGAGLTGGGDLSANRTFDVGAGTGITVNANDVALDVSSARNVDHSGVTLTAGAGLTGGGTIEVSRTFDVGAGTGITVNANDVALDTSSTRNTDHTGVTLTAGNGLTGGGDISANRSFAVGAGTGITVNADDVALTDTAVTPASYGSATSVPSFTVDQQGRLTAASGNTIPTLDSGTYTPTLTNVANLDASTAYECQYLRVGSTVTVSGRVDVDPTTTATNTHLGISLPIASNFAALNECGGAAFARLIAGQGAAILGDSTNNRAAMIWGAVDTTNQAMYFSFTYRII